MKNPVVKKLRHHTLTSLLLLLLLGGLGLGSASAQSDVDLRITGVDLSEFPEVNVRVLAIDGRGAPVADLGNLVVRENRAPVAERTLSRTPAGVDLVFVLDANPSLLQSDDGSGVTRLEKVRASLERFATQAMDGDGLDRVSFVVPDGSGEGATFLVQDAGDPTELTAALAAYDPAEPPRVTPLNEMIGAALDHLAAGQADGRYQAIVLLTDGARLNDQLDYPALTGAAQAGDVTIWPAILGATADPEEVDNVTRLAAPTGGQYTHMPEPDATDTLYNRFPALGQQTNVQYRSLLRRPGEYEVSVSVGNAMAGAPFTLALEQPAVALALPRTTINRAGSASDSPLPLLQPATVAIEVQFEWPDGLPRDLTELAFLVDDRRQSLPFDIQPDESGQLAITWDISSLDQGVYELQVQARDELGYTMETPVQPVTISVTRPAPPAPTPEPTAIALPQFELPVPPELEEPILLGVPVLLALLVAGGVGLWGWRRTKRRQAAEAAAAREAAFRAAAVSRPVPPDVRHKPYLVRLDESGLALERRPLETADVTIGRDPEHASFVVDEGTISRLHARIRRNAAGEYWLYDEGSDSGTFLNYERLALAPRELAHGDRVQFGHVTYRFALELPPTPGENEVESEAIEPPASAHTDDMT